MKIHTHDEMLDHIIGEKGTPRRDAFDAETEAFLTGEAIKAARLAKQMTQEELGELLGVKRAQVSRIESGRNLTLSTISRVFKALGVSASLEVGGVGKVTLA